MGAEENKAIVQRIDAEVWNKGNLDVIDEVIADDCVQTVVGAPEPIRGPQGFKEFVTMYRTAFPDLHITTDQQIAEGDTVVSRWTATGTHQGDLMGIPPTGKQATVSGIHVERFANGKAVESWGIFDQLGLLQQIGAIPAPTAV
jgi:steroid delta-isomerase-like uncharacterized protein